jgi:hypothetical protein
MPNTTSKKEYRCYITDEIIPQERAEYLLSEGIDEKRLTSLRGANIIHKPKKMLFVDDEANYVMCDKIDETRIYAAERFGTPSTQEGMQKEEILEIKKLNVIIEKDEEEDEV